jgi:gas vesicle protein
MDKKKILKEEIDRINELIGGKSQLNEDFIINESNLLVESWVGLFDEVVGVLDNFKKTGKRVSSDMDDLIKSFQRAVTDDDKLLIISRMMDESDDFYKIIFPKVKIVNQKLLDVVEQKIISALKSGKYTPEQIKTVARAQVNQIFKKIPSDKLKKELVDEFNDTIDNFGKSGATGAKASTGVNKFFAYISPKEIESAFRIWRRAFKTAEELQKEFIDLAKKASDKKAAGDRIDAELKKMGDILQATKKWFQNSPKEVWEQWKQQLKTEGKQDIIRDIEYGSGIHEEVWKKLKETPEFMDPYKTMFKAYREAWPFRLPYKSNDLKGFFIFRTDPKVFKRLANTIVYMDPRYTSELVTSLRNKGVQGTMLSIFVSYWVINYGLYPLLYAVLKTPLEAITSWGETVADVFKDERPDWVEFNESDENGTYFWDDFKENFISALPDDVTSLLNFTLIDEAIDVAKVIGSGGIGNVGEEFKSKIGAAQEDAKEKYEELKQDLPPDAKEEVENIENKIEGGGASSGPELNRAKIESITEPIARELYEAFPCIADGNFQVNKISDKQAEFVNLANKKTRMAYKVKGSWYWEDATPLSC